MFRVIIASERNPRVLAELGLGRMHSKIARLEEALDCSFFTPEPELAGKHVRDRRFPESQRCISPQ
jgi:hypothetical protein